LTRSGRCVTIPAFVLFCSPYGDSCGLAAGAAWRVGHGGSMLLASSLILMAATPSQGAPAQQGNFLLLMIPYALIFVVFYFLMIRPTRQRQKEHAKLLDALKPGDKVVCAGGIHATVVGVTDATVQVRIADQVRVDVEKASITAVKRPE